MQRIEVMKTRTQKNEVRYVVVFGAETGNLIAKKNPAVIAYLAKAVGEVKNGQMTFENLDFEENNISENEKTSDLIEEPIVPSIEDFEIVEENKIEIG